MLMAGKPSHEFEREECGRLWGEKMAMRATAEKEVQKAASEQSKQLDIVTARPRSPDL
jgi:hypothetical protein